VEPPAPDEPPEPEEPPVPAAPPAPVMVPEPCKVVTLEPSKDSVTEPFEAATLPSLAILLLLDVVNLSYEEIVEPLIETVIDCVDELVLTATRTTSVSLLYAERDTPDAGLAVASTR
jgi:hypothetical protein